MDQYLEPLKVHEGHPKNLFAVRLPRGRRAH